MLLVRDFTQGTSSDLIRRWRRGRSLLWPLRWLERSCLPECIHIQWLDLLRCGWMRLRFVGYVTLFQPGLNLLELSLDLRLFQPVFGSAGGVGIKRDVVVAPEIGHRLCTGGSESAGLSESWSDDARV